MEERIIYALGFFDGVHKGHGALLETCCALAQSWNCKSGAVTFLEHPDALLQGKRLALITTVEQRSELLQQQIQIILPLPFDEQMMQTPWEEFLHFLMEKHYAAGFVCGTDFRFGKDGEGSAGKLQQFCLENNLAFRAVPQQYIDGMRISSTHIRSLLQQGQMEEAARFMGRSFSVSGLVIYGQQLGRILNFPTANQLYPPELVKVPNGVYVSRVQINDTVYRAVTNIGSRPTVSGTGITVESYILDYSGDLYDRRIHVQLLKYLRPEQRFESLQALQNQIALDQKAAREYV